MPKDYKPEVVVKVELDAAKLEALFVEYYPTLKAWKIKRYTSDKKQAADVFAAFLLWLEGRQDEK